MRLFILLAVFVSFTYAIKLEVINQRRIDILVDGNVYPRVTKLEKCTPDGCNKLTNFTVRENVIKILGASPKAAKSIQPINFTVSMDVYRPDGTVINSTRLSARMNGYKPAEPAIEDNSVYFWVTLAVGIVGTVAVVTVVVSVERQRKKTVTVAAYQFNGEGYTVSERKKEGHTLAKKLGHLVY